MKPVFKIKSHGIVNGVALSFLGCLLSLGIQKPVQAGYGYLELEDGWQCEGRFQGTSGNGLCVRREEVDPGNAYKYYRGDIRNGTFSGRGVLVYENDDRYEGQMRNGRPNGKGLFLATVENRRYEGDFRNGEFHGNGTYTFGNGNRYVGQFAGSQPHGRGTYSFFEDGRFAYSYTGQFYLGNINGNGVITRADGIRCTGVFYSNTMTGKGTCTYPAGSAIKTYTGELKNARPDGKGTMVYRNGTRYSGEFRNGTPGLSKETGS